MKKENSELNFRQKWKLQKEKTVGESLTIQGSSLTIQEVLDRWTQGIQPSGISGTYSEDDSLTHEDEDLEKLNYLDLDERHYKMKEHRENVVNAKAEIEAKRKEAEKREQEKKTAKTAENEG